MKSIEESVVASMDGSAQELFPFLPYILQDLWEIGADPETIIKLIGKHFTTCNLLRVLDLGCGKGAVSIKVAHRLGCQCYGIDAIPEFIVEAKNKAKEYRVEHLCRFEVGDIREKINTLPVFDIIILGAIGPVIGDYHTTLTTISTCLSDFGIIIIDDGYIDGQSDYKHPVMLKKEEILKQIDVSNMHVIDEVISKNEDVKNSDGIIFENLKKRCLELIDIYPDKKKLFENYIKEQEEENEVLENKVICTTMVIARK
ncbi:MAG: class I SAM-dependent methyltransferase [Ignavibacteriae bacterium]|nr:class I SAM-dependent methyltransferase [Ignavibacteriota bacterium]